MNGDGDKYYYIKNFLRGGEILTTSLPSFHHKLIYAMDSPCNPARIMFYLEVLPSFMSRILLEFHHLLRNSGYSNTYRHLHSFLGLRVVSNRTIDKWTVRCKIQNF